MRSHKYNNTKITNRKKILDSLKVDSWAFENADNTLKADPEFMLEAFMIDMSREVYDYGLSDPYDPSSVDRKEFFLEYADKTLKSNRKFLLEAIKLWGMSLIFADKSLKADREFIMEAVKLTGTAIEYADDNLKADRELVLEAVKCDGLALAFVDKSFRADREVVLKAVKQDYSNQYYPNSSFLSMIAFDQLFDSNVNQPPCALQFADDTSVLLSVSTSQPPEEGGAVSPSKDVPAPFARVQVRPPFCRSR